MENGDRGEGLYYMEKETTFNKPYTTNGKQ